MLGNIQRDGHELQQFVSELVTNFPTISSIWLLGSRANATAKPLSDWDILVFADEQTFNNLKMNDFYHRGAVDLLVVTDGDNFKKPYGGQKTGSLTKWKWKPTNNDEAQYEGIKFIPDEPGSNLGKFEKGFRKAHLLYRSAKNVS